MNSRLYRVCFIAPLFSCLMFAGCGKTENFASEFELVFSSGGQIPQESLAEMNGDPSQYEGCQLYLVPYKSYYRVIAIGNKRLVSSDQPRIFNLLMDRLAKQGAKYKN